jgi:predicted PurR-regulated permease PerM
MAEARGPRAAHLMDTGAASSDGSSHAVQPATPPRSLNVTITPRSIWLAMALIVALLVVIVLVTKAQSALVLVFVALILAEGIRPPVRWLNQKAHVPRPLGVLLIYLAALLVFALLVALLLQPVVVQVSTLSSHVPDYLKQLQTLINGILQAFNANAMFGQLATQFASALQSVVPALLGVPSGVLGILFGVVVILTMTIFWLSTTDGFSPFVLDLFPSEKREEVASIFGELSRALGGYVRGTLVNMVAIGVFTGLGLFILGVPYALLLGILAGLTELIPYLGPWISGFVAVVVAVITVDPLKAVEVAVFFVLIQQLEGNTLQPLVMSRAVHINPFVVLVAITIGVELLGVLGAVLAVPAVAVLQVLVLRVLAPAARRAAQRPAPAAGPIEARAIVTPDTPTSSDVLGAPGAQR